MSILARLAPDDVPEMAGARRLRHQRADNRSRSDSEDRGQYSGPDHLCRRLGKGARAGLICSVNRSKKLEPKPQRKRKIAKNHVAPRMVLVAQQRRFGFFANDTW